MSDADPGRGDHTMSHENTAEPRWFVGQEVLLRERKHRTYEDRPVTVERIGRKYVYVKRWGVEVAFSADTGIERGQGNYRAKIGTAESFAAEDRRSEAEDRLRVATRGYSWMGRLSTEQVEDLATLLEGEVTR